MNHPNAICQLCGILCQPFLSTSTDGFSETFLEGDLGKALPVLILDRCPSCGSLWCADNRQDENVLLNTYAMLTDSYFDDIMESPASYAKLFDLLELYLHRYSPGKRICDLGCGDGGFLSHLNSYWERFGIEPSKRAAEKACQRGLNVQAGTFNTCSEGSEYDSIVAIDVIEHLLDPLSTLKNIRTRLRSGGIFIAVTGDSQAWTASVAGPQWSYLTWGGHVSVLSATALRSFLEKSGFTIELWQRCEHPASAGALAWLRVWLLEPIRRILGRPKSWFPYWRDHQLIVARATNELIT